tara:strand:- start:14 stop:763 length:750 start_codon:yes stop_codon:yes gene_type:complete
MLQKKQANKKQYKPMPKIYGYFKLKTDEDIYENQYNDVCDLIKEDITNIYPAYYKSLIIKNINKNDEWVGSITINLQEAGKDIKQEEFNHIVRLINKQSDTLQYIKLFYVSSNEAKGVKYTFTNYVKKDDTPIPHLFFFCETNDININNLKKQLQVILKDDYMDLFTIVNKNKSDYNCAGGYFIKIRLNKEIDSIVFKKTCDIIRQYFNDNYQEDNIKVYYKTEKETNGKRYTATYPLANINTKFIQED